MLIEIIRLKYAVDGTFGVLLIDGEPFCLTLENPWLDNVRNVSCIPEGLYHCSRYSSNKHPNTFIVNNVNNRSYILFHIGNTIKDTDGCILLGSEFGIDSNILYSKRAFDRWIYRLTGVLDFNLRIRSI